MLEFISFLFLTGASMMSDLPSDEQLTGYVPSSNVIVRSSDGEELFYYGEQDRVLVERGDIPQVIVDAFLSAEDSRFLDHYGFDPTATLRATVQNVSSSGGTRLLGGSTITQQLSKMVFVGPKRTVRRKLREAVVAVRWERAVGKEKILETYLNEIYLGRGVFGVSRAAEAYFNSSLDDLAPAQAATLAALIKAPSSLSRPSRADRLLVRRNWVLGQMVENGKISPLTGLLEKRKPLGFSERKPDPVIDSYYEDVALRELFDLFGAAEMRQGGFVAEVGVDQRVQTQLEDTVAKGLLALDTIYPFRGSFPVTDKRAFRAPKGWKMGRVVAIKSSSFTIQHEDGSNCAISRQQTGGPKINRSLTRLVRKGEYVFVEPRGSKGCDLRQVPDISAGAIVMDRERGVITGAVGGFDYSVSQFNRAVQAERQPGSTIKPLTFYAALDLGYRPTETINDAPIEIDLPGGKRWRPQNADRKFVGRLPLEQALYRSRNVPTLALAQELGFRTYWRYATYLGLSHRMPREWSTVLGAAPSTVLDMASAYATMFNDGEVTPGYAITRVSRGKDIVFDLASGHCQDCRPQSRFMRRVEERSVARVNPRASSTQDIRSILRKVVTQGTAVRYGKRMPEGTIGKTGTTNDFKDAWFIGESRPSELSSPTIMAVYVGHDVPKPITRNGTGGRIAAPFYTDFFENVGKVKVETVATQVGYRTISPLNFRTQATLNSSVIQVLPKGAALSDVSCTNRWCEVTFNGRSGFVSKSYITTDAGVAPAVEDQRFTQLRAYMRSSGGTFVPVDENAIEVQIAAATKATKKAKAKSKKKPAGTNTTAANSAAATSPSTQSQSNSSQPKVGSTWTETINGKKYTFVVRNIDGVRVVVRYGR